MWLGTPLLFCLTCLVLVRQSQGDTNNAKRISKSSNLIKTLGSAIMQPNWKFCKRGRTYRYKINTNLALRTCPRNGLQNPRLSKFYSRIILQLFQGAFMTKKQAELKHKSILTQAHDGDACCPTTARRIDPPGTLENMDGHTQQIVQLDSIGFFQWTIPASCVQNRCSGGTGVCRVENRTQCLLVWDIRKLPMPLYFDMFSIPTYCSCKNV